MTSAIAKFNPEQLVDAVREKIRLSVIEIIPKEDWDEMIKKEIERFMTDTTRDSYGPYPYGSRVTVPSDFKQIVQACLKVELEARIKSYFAGPEWQKKWSGEDGCYSDWMLATIKSMSADFVRAHFQHLAGLVVRNMVEAGKVGIEVESGRF